MKIKLPWSKPTLPDPDLALHLEYYHKTNSVTVRHFPAKLDAIQTASFLYYIADLIIEEGMIEITGRADIEQYILNPTTEKPKLRLVK